MAQVSMHIQELFAPEDLIVGFEPVDKWEAIRALVGHVRERHGLGQDVADKMLESVLSRERSMSTGMEHGIAIPHAAVDEVGQVMACMGIVRREEGIDFEAVDGKPVRLVVLLVIPRAQKLLHIRTLADVARALGKGDVRERLLAASDSQAAHAALAGEAAG